MKRTNTLQTFEEYAKKLTSKQVSMLYEAKTHKKYVNALNEAVEDNYQYTMYLDNFTIYDELESDPVTVKEYFEKLPELQGRINISESNEGLLIKVFSTVSKQDASELYEVLIMKLENLGISSAKITDMLDRNYLHNN